jgi:antitoxin (DNA-binding transcriptional repressor) of toxin-antitoxin stability system
MTKFLTPTARARFLEIVCRVRERGEAGTMTGRGEAVAEIRPAGARATGKLEERVRVLQDRGVFQPAKVRAARLRRVARKPGALARFLGVR